MSSAPSDFKVTTVRRLVEAVRSAGVEIGRVEYDQATRKIVVIPGKPAEAIVTGVGQ